MAQQNNPFYVEPAASGALAGLGKVITQGVMKQRQDAANLEQKAKDDLIIAEGDALMAGNDIGKLQSFMLKNPEVGKRIDSAMNFKDDQTRQNAVDTSFKILSGQDPAVAIEERAAFIEANGGDPAQTLSMLDKSPEQQMKFAKMLAAQSASKEQLDGLKAITEKSITPYQSRKLELDERSQKIRDKELSAREETNKLKKEKLITEVKRDAIKLAEAEREQAADLKGGAAKKLLRDSSEGARNAATFANRMITSSAQLNELEDVIDPTNRVIGIISGGSGVTSEVANKIASAKEQQYASAASDFVTAQLRKESGAAIGEQEFERKYREFFPMPGDTADQIKSKKIRRSMAANDMSISSGGLYDALYGETPEVVVDAEVVEGAAEIPEIGFIEDGFKFVGGDPAKESSWEAQ